MTKQQSLATPIPLNLQEIFLEYDLENILENIPKNDFSNFHLKIVNVLIMKISELQRDSNKEYYSFIFKNPYNDSSKHFLGASLFLEKLTNHLTFVTTVAIYEVNEFSVEYDGEIFSFTLKKVYD